MTKSELIEIIAARQTQLSVKDVELAVKTLIEQMSETLASGDRIEIRGFGSFTVRPYKPYDGRNPRTGQPVPVPAKRLPFFKVGKELKELVNDGRDGREPVGALVDAASQFAKQADCLTIRSPAARRG